MINLIIIYIVCLIPITGWLIMFISDFYLIYVLENNKLDDKFLDYFNTFKTASTISKYLKDENIPIKAKKDLRKCILMNYIGIGLFLSFFPILLIVIAIFSK